MRHLNWKVTSAAVVAVAVGLALSGCSGSPTSGGSGSTGGNQVVTILGTNVGVEAQEYQDAWNTWAAQNHITIYYSGDRNFNTDLNTELQGGNLPDIALVSDSQITALAPTGTLKPLGTDAQANMKKYYSADMQSAVTRNGQMYAVVTSAAVKGYIWYSPATFKQYNLTVPTTYDELLTTIDKLQQATGKAPWCAGNGSGDASGWPLADFIGEVVLGSAGTTTYDSWVQGKTPFTDPAIANAFTQAGKILLNPKYVNAGFGDVASINSTAFGDVAQKVADGECAMTNQANFLEASFATTTTAAGVAPKIGPDGDVWAFMMPSSTPGQTSVMGQLNYAGAFNTNAATQKVMAYLSSAEFGTALAKVQNASFIIPNSGSDSSAVTDPLLQNATKIMQDPKTVFRMSADDAMPSVVESAFWAGMVSWINGTAQDTVLQNIQASWASAK